MRLVGNRALSKVPDLEPTPPMNIAACSLGCSILLSYGSNLPVLYMQDGESEWEEDCFPPPQAAVSAPTVRRRRLREDQHPGFCSSLTLNPSSPTRPVPWGPSAPAQGSKHVLVEGAVFCPHKGHQLLDHAHGAQGPWGRATGSEE